MSRNKAGLLMLVVGIVFAGAFLAVALNPALEGSGFDPIIIVFGIVAGGFLLWGWFRTQDAIRALHFWFYQQQWKIPNVDRYDEQHLLLPFRHCSIPRHQLRLVALRETGSTTICGVVDVTYDKSLEKPGQTILTIMEGKLTRPLASWFCVQRENSLLRLPGKDIDLESVEFSRKFRLISGERHFGHAIFAPDFMQWYLDQPRHPWIYGEGHQFFLVYEGVPTVAIANAMIEQMDEVKEFLEDSGAFSGSRFS